MINFRSENADVCLAKYLYALNIASHYVETVTLIKLRHEQCLDTLVGKGIRLVYTSAE